MRSFIAALRSLTLPYGATSGARLVLDGVNGRIEVYNAAGVRIAVIDGTTGFKVTGINESFQVDINGDTWVREVPDVGAYLHLGATPGVGGIIFYQPENSSVVNVTFTPGSMYADASELGALSTPQVRITSPFIQTPAPLARSQIMLTGQSSIAPTYNSRVLVTAGSLQLGNTKFSRPNALYSFSKSIPDSAVTAFVNADFTQVRDSYGLYNGAGALVADRAGIWEIGVICRYGGQAVPSGQRQIRVNINGSLYFFTDTDPGAALANTLVSLSLVIRESLATNDAVSLAAFQTSGGALTCGNSAKFWIELKEDT